MPIKWDISAVENYETLCLDGDKTKLNQVSSTILYMSMFVELGTITEKNFKEFYIRTELYQLLFGDVAIANESEYKIDRVRLTIQDIYNHIGFKVNIKSVGRTAYLAKLWRTSTAKEVADKFNPQGGTEK